MSKSPDMELATWLFENGGSVIRYGTVTELSDSLSVFDLDRLERDLLASPLVRKWLANLGSGPIHGSKDTYFENAMGKLLEFGLRAGMRPFHGRTHRFRRWLEDTMGSRQGMMDTLNSTIVAAGLARAGYAREKLVRAFLLKRLDHLHETIRRFGHDIYIDADTFGDMPKAWRIRNRPLIDPDIYPGGAFGLPYIHDLYGLSALPADAKGRQTNKKINAVIRYVLSPEHQALEPGYGLLRHGKGRYYAIGWRTDLPGYGGSDLDAHQARVLAQRVELMAHFPEARRHAWFGNAVQHLEGFCTQRDSYLFPRRYLQETRNQYWVSGGHMGLEENRRPPRAIELESTFRMLRIKRACRQQ